MKKILLATVASAVFATAAQADARFKNGFYAGAQAGASFMNHKHNVTYVDAFGPATFNFKKSKSKTGFTGGLMVGGRMFSNCGWSAGLELAGNFNSGKTSFTVNDPTVPTQAQLHTLKQKWSFNPALHLGRAWGNTFLYAKLGLAMKKFTARTSFTNNGAPLAAIPAATKSKTKTAFAPGLGLEWAFHNAFSLRGEVDYEFNGRVKNTLLDPTTAAFTSDTNKVKIHTTNVRLGLIYRM